METVKLQKYFTDCGVLSRRAAEAEIAAGRVKVNGEIAYLGMRIDPNADSVEYKGRKIIRECSTRTTVMLNKPRGYVTTLSDEKGRATVSELVSDLGIRVYPIGRLDMDSDGLLLLTDDGELANKLTHPKHEIPKIYRVTVKGKVDKEILEKLGGPMVIDGYEILPVNTVIFSEGNTSTILEMKLYEGRNRQIRKMCKLCDLEITRLQRIAVGDVKLGTLPIGKWRRLTPSELEYLKK